MSIRPGALFISSPRLSSQALYLIATSIPLIQPEYFTLDYFYLSIYFKTSPLFLAGTLPIGEFRFMKKINTSDIIDSLQSQDVIFQNENELYRITKITDMSISIFQINSVGSLQKKISFEDLIKENWHVL